MTKKELLNKIEKQQEIIDALFSHLKLEYKEEEYIQKSFIGESKIKTRIVVSERKNVFDMLKALTEADNAIDAAKVLMKAGLDEKTALYFANELQYEIVKNASDNIIKKYKSNGRKTTHNKTK